MAGPERKDHTMSSDSKRYEDSVAGVELMFEYELCAECLQDIDQHIISPDMFGLAHAWCVTA